MLGAMRDQSRSVWIWATFGVLIFVFVFFFGQQTRGFAPSSRSWAARIADLTVYDSTLNSRFDRAQYRANRSGRLTDEEFYKLKRDVMNDIALTALLADRAKASGMAVTHDELS